MAVIKFDAPAVNYFKNNFLINFKITKNDKKIISNKKLIKLLKLQTQMNVIKIIKMCYLSKIIENI
jgi:hypothetical protein